MSGTSIELLILSYLNMGLLNETGDFFILVMLLPHIPVGFLLLELTLALQIN